MFNPNHPSAQLRDNITRFLLQGEASGQFAAQLERDIQDANGRFDRDVEARKVNFANLLAETAAKREREAAAESAEREAAVERAECEAAASVADFLNFKLHSLDDVESDTKAYYAPLFSGAHPEVDFVQQFVNDVAEATGFDLGYKQQEPVYMDLTLIREALSEEKAVEEEKTEFAFADILTEDNSNLDERYLGTILEDVYQNIFMLQSYRDERVNRRSIGWIAWGETEPSFPVFPARVISVPVV